MPLKYIHQKFVKYHMGNGYVSGHVEALHAKPPKADVYTDDIAEKMMIKLGCAGIISEVSRIDADLNRSPNGENDQAIKEYRASIKEFLAALNILNDANGQITLPYLHLSLHGMKDNHYGPYGVEVGTVYGQSCSEEISDWFKENFKKRSKEILPELKLVFDEKFVGDPSIVYHRLGDGKDYHGYGNHFHTFQIELSRTIRSKHRAKIENILSQMMLDFQKEFVIA